MVVLVVVPIEPKWPYYQQMNYLAPFMKHRSTRSNFAVEERAPLPTASNVATTIEEESFYYSTNEACDVDNFSAFEVETVEESPKSPKAASFYSATVNRKSKRPGSSLETVSPSPSETVAFPSLHSYLFLFTIIHFYHLFPPIATHTITSFTRSYAQSPLTSNHCLGLTSPYSAFSIRLANISLIQHNLFFSRIT